MESESHKASLARYTEQLVEDYQEMHTNATQPTYYDAPPCPLEALRMINKSRPAIIKGHEILTSKGKEKAWELPQTYIDIMGDKRVSIAVTEDGLADSVQLIEGEKGFVKPLNEEMSLSTFLDRLSDATSKEIVYLQSQDGNIYRSPPRPDSQPQLEKLQEFIEPEVRWMQEAIGNGAEAVNLWIGSSRSVTSFHHDPFENIYHVLSGSKTFSLVSPIEGLFFDQRFYPQYTLHRSSSGIDAIRDPGPTYDVPWVESLHPPPGAKAVEVEVKAGETLYLPAGWWHRVSQSPGEGGLAVAVNYWYPSEPDSQVWAYERLSRRIAREAGMRGVIPIPGDEDDNDDDSISEEAGIKEQSSSAGGGGKIEEPVGEIEDDEEEKEREKNLDLLWGDEEEFDSGSGEEWDPKEWGR